MENPTAAALHSALSVLSNDTHAAIVFLLEQNHGIKLTGKDASRLNEIKKALEDIFGSAAEVIIHNMEKQQAETKVMVPAYHSRRLASSATRRATA